MLSFFFLKASCELVLDIENAEWNKIENNWNIERSKESVEDSCSFMEASSFAHCNFTTSGCDISWVMTDGFDMVFSEGLKVKLRNFHDDMKRNEMNDSNFNLNLERE